MFRRLTIVLGLLAVSVAVLGTRLHKKESSTALNPLGTLPDFALTAASAAGPRGIARKDLLGRVWIADLIFTKCGGPCPAISLQMSRLQKALPKDIGLVSFTVDPDRDSPVVLQEYARRFQAQEGRWFFVTGEKKSLHELIRQGFHLPVAEDEGGSPGLRLTHSTKFVLIDPQGAIRGYYDGDNPQELSTLSQDARKLLRESPHA